jgi:hypothetical protein
MHTFAQNFAKQSKGEVKPYDVQCYVLFAWKRKMYKPNRHLSLPHVFGEEDLVGWAIQQYK